MPDCPLNDVDEPGAVEQAALVLAAGDVIVFPTDTVYGLLAHPHHQSAYQRIYSIKQRPPGQPLALLAHHQLPLAMAAAGLLDQIPDMRGLFLSGELTVVFDSGALCLLPAAVTACQPGPTGLRLPADERTRRLLEHCGGLLWATSANLSGQPEVRDRVELERMLSQAPLLPALALFSASGMVGRASRVARLTRGEISWIRQ